MQLEGQAHDEQNEKAGKYTKANGLYSRMPYWIQSNGTNALWFVKGNWMLGKKSELGENGGYFKSTNSPSCPESVGSN